MIKIDRKESIVNHLKKYKNYSFDNEFITFPEGMSIAGVAEAVGVSKSTASFHLRLLEARGLLESKFGIVSGERERKMIYRLKFSCYK